MSNSLIYVCKQPKTEKKIYRRVAGSKGCQIPRLDSVSPFFYLLLQFSRFLQSDFCKMLVRGLSKKLKNRFLNFCLQKIWHTDKVGVPKKLGFFSKHQLGQCAKFFVGKNSKIRFMILLDKPLTSILRKTVCKNLENCRRR